MKTKAIAELLLTKLSEEMTDIAVSIMPDNPESYQLQHPDGELLIWIKNGGTLTPPIGRTQGKILAVSISIMARSLMAEDVGVLDLCDRVRIVLTNDYSIMGANLYCINDGMFIDYTEGIWNYESTFIIPSVVVLGT